MIANHPELLMGWLDLLEAIDSDGPEAGDPTDPEAAHRADGSWLARRSPSVEMTPPSHKPVVQL